MLVRFLIIAAIVLALSPRADAQLMMNFFGEGGMGGPAGAACDALQFDLSDSTGCNMTGFIVFLK